MLNFVIISILSVCIGTLKAEATTTDKIKGIVSKQYGECQKTCQESCIQYKNLKDQQSCWIRRDKCQKSFFKITACHENESTANHRGNTQVLEVLEDIYRQVPQVRYYFDKTQQSADRTELNTLSGNEKRDLKENLAKGINIILKYCDKSISEMEKVRNPSLPPEEVKISINQIKDMRSEIKKVKNIILDDKTYNKQSKLTKLSLKEEIDKGLLNFKNIFNQGAAFKWKIQNPPSLRDCQNFCGSDKCLKDNSLEKYCAVHCKMCNSPSFKYKKYQQKKDTKKQEKAAQNTPKNVSDEELSSTTPQWTRATPNLTNPPRKILGSASEKAASINPEKSRDLQAIAPAAPPRPSRLPKASPPPLPPLPPAQGGIRQNP